jgi:uncharacterized SAM-binding protein YcdF (DUF218 family)
MTYIQPLILFASTVALLGLMRVSPGRGRRLALTGVLGFLLLSWPPVDWLLSRPLELPFPVARFSPSPDLEAIVVLGSGVQTPACERPYLLPDGDTFARCEHAAWMYRQRPSVPVLACGGGPVAVMMRELLQRAGVPENMIWLDLLSRSTHENAKYGARILRAHGVRRIALVVEAQSMLRAQACFRKEGFAVTPAPSDFRTFGPWRNELMPNWQTIRRNEITLHEFVGYAWYRLRGWV